MADNPQTKTQKLIKYGNEKFGLNETTLRGIIDNASVGTTGSNGEYNIESIIEADGTQTLKITDWDYVPKPKFDRVFANNTPAQIDAVSKEIASNGYTSAQVAEIYGWNLGDTIPITLTSGEVIEMQIIGYNHDFINNEPDTTAGITLQMKDCLATRYGMNSTGGTNAGGYAASKLKTKTLPTLKALLPQEWQDVIKLVDKKSANGGSTKYSETLTLSEDLFLFAEIEIFGTTSYAQDGANEGSVYEYWNGKAAVDRIKKYDTVADGVADTATIWWLRSAKSTSTTNFCVVDTDGNILSTNAGNPRGVAFGFCI